MPLSLDSVCVRGNYEGKSLDNGGRGVDPSGFRRCKGTVKAMAE